MIPIWVLNLDRSADRWANISEQAKRQGIVLHRWASTDGAAVGLAALIERGTIAANADFIDLANAASIAGLCDSSVSLWQHLIGSDQEWFILLEDDVVLPNNFTQLIEQAWHSLPSDAEVVLLGCDFWQRATTHLDAQRLYQSIQPFKLPFWKVTGRVGGTFAYAVNRAGLAKLLSQAPFHHAVDYFPYNLSCYLLAFHTEPHYSEGMVFYGIIKCNGAASTVQV